MHFSHLFSKSDFVELTFRSEIQIKINFICISLTYLVNLPSKYYLMEHKPLKIVYVTPALYMAGGVERVLTLKANYFVEQFGYDVTIILTEGKGKSLFYPLSDKIKIINLDINFEELWTCSFLKKISVYLGKQRQFKNLLTAELMQHRPDITISLLRREINFLNEIKDGSKKIGEIHINRANYRNFDENESNFIKRQFAKCWLRGLVNHLKKLDRFVVLTEKDREAWIGLANISVIPDPLPFQPHSFSKQTEKRVVAIARYSHEKGVDLLLQAWKLVETKCPDWRLDVFGDGERMPYEHLMDDLQISRSCCQLHGRTNDVEKEYCNSSIYVLSSRFEGFGLVLLEAMSCGLPIVAFDCPWGPRSIIHHNVDGLLAPNGDVSQLADAMISLMQDKDKRIIMSAKAIQTSGHYRIDGIAQQWKQLFESVM